MNLCRGCGEDFGSVSAFDRHRVGRHAHDWSPERLDGRRCLDVDELEALGWHQDSRGRWRQPRSENHVTRLSAFQARGGLVDEIQQVLR